MRGGGWRHDCARVDDTVMAKSRVAMHVTNRIGYLSEQLIDWVGIKSGLAIDRQRFQDLLNRGADLNPESISPNRWWTRRTDEIVRVEATELERVFALLMNQLGAIRDLMTATDLMVAWLKGLATTNQSDEERRILHQRIVEISDQGIAEEGDELGLKVMMLELRRRSILNQIAS